MSMLAWQRYLHTDAPGLVAFATSLALPLVGVLTCGFLAAFWRNTIGSKHPAIVSLWATVPAAIAEVILAGTLLYAQHRVTLSRVIVAFIFLPLAYPLFGALLIIFIAAGVGAIFARSTNPADGERSPRFALLFFIAALYVAFLFVRAWPDTLR